MHDDLKRVVAVMFDALDKLDNHAMGTEDAHVRARIGAVVVRAHEVDLYQRVAQARYLLGNG